MLEKDDDNIYVYDKKTKIYPNYDNIYLIFS